MSSSRAEELGIEDQSFFTHKRTGHIVKLFYTYYGYGTGTRASLVFLSGPRLGQFEDYKVDRISKYYEPFDQIKGEQLVTLMERLDQI